MRGENLEPLGRISAFRLRKTVAGLTSRYSGPSGWAHRHNLVRQVEVWPVELGNEVYKIPKTS
jgi:hypothetical protein